jgi:hypothetical protein
MKRSAEGVTGSQLEYSVQQTLFGIIGYICLDIL